MEFLAMLYTVLLVAICLMMALLLFRSGRPTGGLDEADCEELKDWLEEQLAAGFSLSHPVPVQSRRSLFFPERRIRYRTAFRFPF